MSQSGQRLEGGRQAPLTVLTINGETFDFSSLPEGATLPREAVECPWLAADVERTGGALHLTLILPHGADAPPETLFPEPVIDPANGPVALPPRDAPPEASGGT